ncbi:LLM class flavin-dependent oxidoreductase [Streptomyces graminifolii]|uniref:LLM class flavin-dependent oxidoreductase n=1 Tax=Streptomyces graminifolii TaxID=1266771 RepID=UPI004058EF48
MRIGIGLPATLPGVQRTQLLEWARRAEARGFSTLAAFDRLVYDNLEPLIALSAAAAVTTRIRLATTILIAPLRANPVLLAKQAASLNRLADGRLTLGLAPGGRQDDFTTSNLDFHTRGRTLDHQLTRLHDTWNNPHIGPHHTTPASSSAASPPPPSPAPPPTPTAGSPAAATPTSSATAPNKPTPPGTPPTAPTPPTSPPPAISVWDPTPTRVPGTICATTTPSPGHWPTASPRACSPPRRR